MLSTSWTDTIQQYEDNVSWGSWSATTWGALQNSKTLWPQPFTYWKSILN